MKKEWLCAAHGPFESDKPVCPRGCAGKHTIERRFYNAPGLTGARTKNIDRTLATLAHEYGLSDMNNHGGTSAAAIPRRQAPDFTPQWGQVAPGGTYQVGKGVIHPERGRGALASIGAYGSQGGNELANVKGITAPRPQIEKFLIDRSPIDINKAPD